MRQQLGTERLELRDAHVKRKCLMFLRERPPIDIVERVLAMRRDKSHRLRVIAMRQRHARVRRACDSGSESGNDFIVDPIRAEKFEFFSTASENERITTLEPNDSPARPRVFEHERVDSRLRGVVIFPDGFADFDALRIAPGQIDYLLADEPVVKNHVRFVECAQRAQREQACISRTRANKNDRSLVRAFLIEDSIQFACCANSVVRPQPTPNRTRLW